MKIILFCLVASLFFMLNDILSPKPKEQSQEEMDFRRVFLVSASSGNQREVVLAVTKTMTKLREESSILQETVRQGEEEIRTLPRQTAPETVVYLKRLQEHRKLMETADLATRRFWQAGDIASGLGFEKEAMACGWSPEIKIDLRP